MDWDWLAAELAIVERLKTNLQSGPDAWAKQIGTRADLTVVAEEMQHAPAVWVVYDGHDIREADEQRAAVRLRFLVILAVSSAIQGRDETRNQEASRYLPQIFTALHGWRPPQCVRGLTPVSPPRPYYSQARFAYFPTAWETSVIHSTRMGPVFSRHPGQS
ncbi:MAG: hypothetical protein FWF20_11780 [Betaproteobacteria bacterium]|nr:hypothetical protein [Betaproteobacteria bacterium]MCL2887429.1 hypothetical protein [Betaproteobacteria bacterium]